MKCQMFERNVPCQREATHRLSFVGVDYSGRAGAIYACEDHAKRYAEFWERFDVEYYIEPLQKRPSPYISLESNDFRKIVTIAESEVRQLSQEDKDILSITSFLIRWLKLATEKIEELEKDAKV